MKKSFVLILILLAFAAFVGCDFFPTLPTGTTGETTTDPRNLALEAEFAALEPALPLAIIDDYVLPQPTHPSITVSYTFDGDPIAATLVYVAPALDTVMLLEVTLTYETAVLTRSYEVLVIRDEETYELYMTDLGFRAIEDLIDAGMPEEISSDFTIPKISYGSAEVVISAGLSRIYHGRFVFTFPVADDIAVFTARVIYNGQTRYYEYRVVMKGIDALPHVPELHLWLEGNNEVYSKDEYLSGVATMITYDEDMHPTTVFENRSMQIRGRGNSTWYMPKKPYKIKFDEKTPMFTDYEAKDWVLLANFTDQTLIRNYLAYRFAAAIGMEYTPSATFIDVYMNGDYIGNYMLTDQIEASPVRVAVETDSSAVDTGYLFEFDYKIYEDWTAVENVDYFMAHGYPYTIKSPQPDGVYFNNAQVVYIKDFVDSIYETLANRRVYTDLIDEASFIDWFIVQEVFKNVDSGYSSVYMYKAKGGVLKMGPVWDFDLSAGNPGHLDYDNRMPPGWYTSRQDKNLWFYYLMKYESFRLHLQTRWNELYETEVLAVLASVYPVSDAIARSRHLNFQRWDVIGHNWEWYTSPEVYEADSYEEQMELLYDWLEQRIAWMDDAINDPDFV